MSDRIILKWPMDDPQMGGMMLPGPVIAVGWQHDRLTLWIDHAVEARKVNRQFIAIPTGQAFATGAEHVGSAISNSFVFHVYELEPLP